MIHNIMYSNFCTQKLKDTFQFDNFLNFLLFVLIFVLLKFLVSIQHA